MQRNARNKIAFKEVATGKVIEVAAPTAHEITRHQQALLAAGKEPEYVLYEEPNLPGLEAKIRSVVSQILAEMGAGKISADGKEAKASVAPAADEPSDAETEDEEVLAAMTAIRADGDDEKLTENGNPTKAAVQEFLGKKVSQRAYLAALKATN